MSLCSAHRLSWSLAAATLLLAGAARADSARLLPAQVPKSYTQECGACHTAYPPGMLPARSWHRIMSGLDKHYGADASLDSATVQQLGTWLQNNAGTYKRTTEKPPQDRITRSAWFMREHRKIDAAVWSHASIKSAANCAACHTRAEQGDFDDDNLRIPSGLDARYHRAFRD